MWSTFSALASVLSFFTAVIQAQGTTGQLGDAAIVIGNPIGATYIATLPNNLNNSVRGSVVAQSAPDGNGVRFAVVFSGLPEAGGPFLYHIHVDPVPANGNCTAALAHLDPYVRGENPVCDANYPQTCQVGDLSGKHGQIYATAFSANYIDPYASLVPDQGAFFGNRSIVVHYANKTRIACANFVPYSNSSAVATNATSILSSPIGTATTSTTTGSSTGTTTGTMTGSTSSVSGRASGTSSTSSMPAASTGGASGLGVQSGVVAVLAGVVALLM